MRLFVKQDELGNALPPRQRGIDAYSPYALNDVAVGIGTSRDFVPDVSSGKLPVEVESIELLIPANELTVTLHGRPPLRKAAQEFQCQLLLRCRRGWSERRSPRHG